MEPGSLSTVTDMLGCSVIIIVTEEVCIIKVMVQR